MKKFLFISIILFLLIISSFFVWQEIYLPKNSDVKEEKIFVVEKGQNLFQIAENLEKERLIKNKFFFDFYVILKRKEKKLQAGGYSLSSSMTIPEITKKIVSGEVIKEKITILEGWNKNEIANYLEEKGIVKAKDFLEKTKYRQWKDQFDFLRDRLDYNSYDRRNHGQIEEWDVDGYLFPDTYFIEYTVNSAIAKNTVLTKEEKIIKKMLDNFDKKLNPELRNEISGQGKKIFEIVIMASMLEKEVKSFEDKKLVSGILWKRLEQGIPLQVDATITFITGKKTTGISIEDLQIDSPFNTYKYKGLPFGPICNPGIDSILAAIYPQESDFWYYLSIPDGKTIFSKTLEEHNLAKAKYLK
jgi:UPF0755 protein